MQKTFKTKPFLIILLVLSCAIFKLESNFDPPIYIDGSPANAMSQAAGAEDSRRVDSGSSVCIFFNKMSFEEYTIGFFVLNILILILLSLLYFWKKVRVGPSVNEFWDRLLRYALGLIVLLFCVLTVGTYLCHIGKLHYNWWDDTPVGDAIPLSFVLVSLALFIIITVINFVLLSRIKEKRKN